MLGEKLAGWRRIKNRLQSRGMMRKVILHALAKFRPEPCRQRRRKPLLLSPANLRRNPCRKRFTKQRLPLPMSQVIVQRQVSDELEQTRVQKRRSTFESAAHAGPIHFYENLFRKISKQSRFYPRTRVSQPGVAPVGGFQFCQPSLDLLAMRRKKPFEERSLGVAGAKKLPIVLPKKIKQTPAAPSIVVMPEGSLRQEIYSRCAAQVVPAVIGKRRPVAGKTLVPTVA